MLYSGNWEIEIEQSYTGTVRANLGVNPKLFSWRLGGASGQLRRNRAERGLGIVSSSGSCTSFAKDMLRTPDRSTTGKRGAEPQQFANTPSPAEPQQFATAHLAKTHADEIEELTNSFFETPECVCVFSNTGLSGITTIFHNLIKQKLMHPRWRLFKCPVLINTWETYYFEVTHKRILDLGRKAKQVGVELLVLDDGWFGNRHDEHSGLGDWREDLDKLPQGLRGLSEDLRKEVGVGLGIWMEPEMINRRSQL